VGTAVLVGILVIALVPALFVISMYNSLIGARNHCDESWSDVQTELQRRYSLIPNLVNSVKGYAKHERELLEEVTRLRQVCADNTGSPQAQAATERQLQTALGSLMVRMEAYPELKANQNFIQLQSELTNTEDRIQAAFRFYNGNVREFNNKTQMFPSNIIAGMFSFSKKEFFELEEPLAKVAPKVEF
jgi:LemA protein